MPKKPAKRLPKVGDEITLKARVTRVDERDKAPGDSVTVLIHGLDYPVTILARYLGDEES